MSDQLTDIFLSNTYLVAQAKRRLIYLNMFLNYKLYGGLEQSPTTQFTDHDWLIGLDSDFINTFNQENCSQLIKDLTEAVNKIPVLTIILSTDLPEDKLVELGSWVRQKSPKLLLVDIKTDPKLIAGCALIWNGIYRDYSIKSQIEDNQTQILESFKGYLK